MYVYRDECMRVYWVLKKFLDDQIIFSFLQQKKCSSFPWDLIVSVSPSPTPSSPAEPPSTSTQVSPSCGSTVVADAKLAEGGRGGA